VTEKALLEARAVVVLWSPRSVVSRWVRAEATQADRNKTLLPVMIEPCTRPIMFELTQTADLSQWEGDTQDSSWVAFVEVVAGFVNPAGSTTASNALPPSPAPPPAARTAPGSRSRKTLLGAALAALLLIGVGIYWFGRRADVTAASASTAPISLAVLPFADLSAEKDQEYFSDGLAEELLNELTQLKELRVAGRTSSFSFKGKNEDLRIIGQKLGVSRILEGSVRKAGNRLRITAQLIDATSGSRLWSNAYDRELRDVFAVQEEIAMAVTNALSVTLDVGASSRANGGTTNVAAYDKFLQGQALWYQGGKREVFERASQLFREAIALDPQFARAWYGLHKSAEQELVLGSDAAARRKDMAEAKERLEALAPKAWFTQSIRVTDLVYQRKWAEAESIAVAALAASPRPETSLTYGVFLQRVGRAKEALEYIRRAADAEPLSGAMSLSLQLALDMAGRPDEAQAEYTRGKTLEGTNWLADSFAVQRAWAHARPDVPAIEAMMRSVNAAVSTASVFTKLLDKWQDRPKALAELRRSPNRTIIFAAMGDHYGDKEMVFDVIRTQLVERNGPQIFSLWQFNESGWRNDPRFKQVLRDLGLVTYYQSSGHWPDVCRPLAGDDFECA
jgi:TolB-like protein